MTTPKQLPKFEKAPKFDFFSTLGRPARSDLLGLKEPIFTNPIEEEYHRRKMRRLFERVRAMPVVEVVLPTHIEPRSHAADLMITLDSMGALDSKPKRLLSLSRTPRSREDRPIFQLSFDPLGPTKDVS